jgi:hypothetical protein
MEMVGGKSFPEVCVDSFSVGYPESEFSIRLATEGKIAEQSFPVSENNVISIDFKALAPAAAPSSGRTANLLMGHGGKFDGVVVVKYEKKDGAGVFTMRTAGAPPDSAGYPVMSSHISKLQFADVSAAIAPAVAPAGTLVNTPTPPPAMGENLPGAPPAFLTTTDNGSQEEPSDTRRRPSGFLSRKTTERTSVDDNRLFGLGKMMSTTSGRILLEVIIRAILAIINGFVVLLSVRAAGEPISFPKALLTGFLISIVGGLVWKLCMLIPICLVNLFIAIVAWFFTARAIIMGMVEVMEGKATAIVITIIVLNIVVWVGIMFLIVGGTIAALTM